MSYLPFQAWDDFDTYTIGTNVTGYTLRGGGAPTYKPQYSTTAILPYKRRYLEFLTDATTDYHAVSRDAVDSDANRATFDIVFGFAVDLCTVEELHVYARGQGTSSMTDFLRASIVLATGAIRIDKMVGSAYTAGSGASAGTVTLTAGHAYFGRFRGSGGNISLKIWDASLGAFADRQFAGEPAAFNITPTGMTPTAAGWIALGGRHSTLTGKVAAFNFDATATNGDVAVCPRTNTEYTAWLAKQDVLRAVVAKLRATGYDSGGSPYTKTVKAYIANHGYTSAAQDTPSLQHFDACITGVPTFSREMPAALSGQATVNIGKLRIDNSQKAEGVRYQNYALKSEAFDAAATWAPTNCTIATSAATPPRGGARADKLTQTGVGGRLIQTYTAPGGVLTGVWRVKQDTATTQTVILRDNTAGVNYQGDLTWSTMVFAVSGAGATGYVKGIDNGWVELVIVTPAITVGNQVWQYIYGGGSGSTATVFVSMLQLIYGATRYAYARTDTTAQDYTVQGGTRDDWLRIHWLRDGFELLMGGPTWPLHDFRHLLRGRLGNPTAPDLRTIEFPIADYSEVLNKPLSTRISGGPFDKQFKPKLFGNCVTAQLEPPQTDAVNLIYMIHSGATGPLNGPMYDNQVAIVGISGLTVSAVNTGTGEITASALHGMVNNYSMIFVTGTPPLGLALGVRYYLVGTTGGTDKFKLSLTRGGAAITGGAGTTGAGWLSYGFTTDEAAGTMQLAAAPAGRVTVENVNASGGTAKMGDLYAQLFFTELALSLNYKDASAFTQLNTDLTDVAHAWFDTMPHTGDEVAAFFAANSPTWYGFSCDALLQVGRLQLPGTSVLSLDRSDIADIRLAEVIRPVYENKATYKFDRWFVTQGPFQTGTPAARQLYNNISSGNPAGAAGVPLDDHPDQQDADQTRIYEMGMLATAVGNNEALFKHKLGVFEITTKLRGMWRDDGGPLCIGDTISVDFPRLGFKQWSASDPASPDNTATIDSRLCVVIGIAVNLDAKATEKVRLKVFRRIPGYYPTSNLN